MHCWQSMSLVGAEFSVDDEMGRLRTRVPEMRVLAKERLIGGEERTATMVDTNDSHRKGLQYIGQ